MLARAFQYWIRRFLLVSKSAELWLALGNSEDI
jgi:hypothetical protein